MFEEELVLGEEMENFIHMGEMGWPCFTIDENIIKENLYTHLGFNVEKLLIHWVCPWGQVSSQGVVT
jgi:hypothetical protein